MQSKQELEDWYEEPDKWGYFSNTEDAKRLEMILSTLKLGKSNYSKALDVGCGEGFITAHIPANEVYGIDLSDNATNRLPKNVHAISIPEGKYDLVISTGTLYQQYDHDQIYRMIMDSASEYILIGGIADWLISKDFGKEVYSAFFPYREFHQKITLYHV